MIGDNVHVRGQFTFDQLAPATVDIQTTGLPDTQKEVTTLTVAATSTHVFFGTGGPYWTSDTNADGQIDANETNADAVGFSLADVDFGLAVMKPTSVLDSAVYYSLKATANDVEFVGNDLVDFTVSQISVEINEGVDPLSLGFPTGVDFRSSFETSAGADDGALQIATGGDPISLDASEPVARVTSQGATLSLSDYVHAVGNFSFAYSAHSNVVLGTGLPANLGDVSSALLDSLNQAELDFGFDMSADLSTISNLEVATTQFGASDVSVFVGINGPYKIDTDGDGDLSDETPNDDAAGLWLEDVDFAFARMEPTLPALASLFPSFYAIKAEADNVGLVGFESVELSADQVTLTINDGSTWPGGIGPAVVDWASSFPAESTDTDGDGKIDPAGFEVATPGNSLYIDWDGNQRIGASVTNARMRLAEYMSLSGNLAFEKGPTYRVDIDTNFPGDILNLVSTAGDLIPQPVEDFIQSLTGQDFDLSRLEGIDVESLQVGASDITAFIGLGGPY